MTVFRICFAAALAGLAALAAQAFPSVPRASAEALGVTKGKAFDEGVVFVNGKYLPPPYVVERWGTGLRINGRKVSGQIIDWTEFLKTQSGVKVTRTEPSAPGVPEAPVELAPEPGSAEDDSDSSLDDLFDDDAAKKPKARAKAGRKAVRKAAVRKPAVTTSYALNGSFVPNDASKALLRRINTLRSEIDRTLRLGGFVCFGDDYPRVTGDARTALRLLERLPDIMQGTEGEAAFGAAVREAHLELLTGNLCRDLYRNRIDYLALRKRRETMLADRELKRVIEGSGDRAY